MKRGIPFKGFPYTNYKMKIKYCIILFVLILAGTGELFSQYPSFRIFPSSNYQIEPFIVRHPSNPQIMFASSYNVISQTSFRSEGVYVTTNGGQTWFGSDTCKGIPLSNHAGDPGPIIDKDGRFLITHLGTFPPGMFANYSTNNGISWSNNFTIMTGDNDKGSPATDAIPSSPFYGRTYVAFTRYVSPFPVVLSYTSNGGDNWSAIIQVNNSISGHQSIGANLVSAPSGVVYVTWASAILGYPYNEDYLGFASSANGGLNWNVNETAIDVNGIKTTSLSPWGIRVNSYPLIDVDVTTGPRNGWIYILTAEKNHSPAGSDPDIILYRSTNGGTNWSQGIRVNQDPVNNGKVQYFPAVRVDEDGGLNVVYYDNRNISSDSMELYLSRSTNGGDTWNDYLVSNHRFKPKPINGAGTGNQGDNIGMTSGNGKLWPVWMDDYTGNYQIWTASIDYHAIGVKKISNDVPQYFSLLQNYPNPFNPSTKISFSVPPSKKAIRIDVKIVIYDALGKEAAVLLNEQLPAGTYEVSWSASDYPSGVYFYKLTANGFEQTKKMVLVK